MNIRVLVQAFCAILILLPVLPASTGATCGKIDIAALAHEVAETVGLPRQTLFVTERDDLSGRLIGLQYLVKTAGLGRRDPSLPLPVNEVLVFELSRQGHRLADGVVVEMTIDLDDAPLWRVA